MTAQPPKARRLAAALLAAALAASSASAQPPLKPRKAKPEPKTREEIVKPLEKVPQEPPPKENLLARLLGALSFQTSRGPVIFFPVLDSSRDFGPNFGLMPLAAFRDEKTKAVKAVLAPSVNYNEYLRTTFTWRHYVFPDDKRLLVMRASLSERVEREAIAYYYTPGLFGTSARLSAEAKHSISGKNSFYGYGEGSSSSDQANYALDTSGEEFTLDIPIIRHLYLDFTHAYYVRQVKDGPLKGVPQLRELFPADYGDGVRRREFLTSRFALLYDDTDHPFLPKIGTYASASVTYSARRLGSDYDYRVYAFETKQYYNYRGEGRFVTALRWLLQFQRGDRPPFYAQQRLGESTGLRVAGDGRFTDYGKMVFNVEERITLSSSPFFKFISETEIAPFLDVGTVFPRPSEFSASKLRYSPGVGLRLVIRPQVVVTADIAFGSEGTNAIIKVGYPF